MKKFFITLGVLVAIAVGGCFLLPERFAVNAPILSMLLARTRRLRQEVARRRHAVMNA